MYSYLCSGCGESFDDVSPQKQRHLKRKCPHCGGWGKRDVKSELAKSGRFNAMMKDNPRKSCALGINPAQIDDFHRTWPWMRFDEQGNCLIQNRQEKLRVMKARGYDEIE